MTKIILLAAVFIGTTVLPASARDRCWRRALRCEPPIRVEVATPHYYTSAAPAPCYTPVPVAPCPTPAPCPAPVTTHYYTSAPSYAPPCSIALGPELVASVQHILACKGYYGGVIDGVFGPVSQTAVAAWQADHGLVVTGNLDSVTLRSLGWAE